MARAAAGPFLDLARPDQRSLPCRRARGRAALPRARQARPGGGRDRRRRLAIARGVPARPFCAVDGGDAWAAERTGRPHPIGVRQSPRFVARRADDRAPRALAGRAPISTPHARQRAAADCPSHGQPRPGRPAVRPATGGRVGTAADESVAGGQAGHRGRIGVDSVPFEGGRAAFARGAEPAGGDPARGPRLG